MLSAMFIFMNHPLSLGGVLLIQTILISILAGSVCMNFWYSYILFLVMIGGMLVMFIYMTSIASNEKFKLPQSPFPTFIFVMTILLALSLSQDKFLMFQFNISNMTIPFMQNIDNFYINKYFNYPGMFMLISLMVYLLITLIATVKITDKSNSSLRQK
uniref:NADH-ubiquinone oxidoreductase chain 6 n=1 Tax=Trigonopterus sp. 3 AH-2016 TaxID=1903837 RepID=A0A343C408_9CUCU|nr:NADH dehydrogenase subunit 6 [Trigonopterus sp. 3 AH-2016]